MIICQDRLGTNIGKTQKREYRFFLQSPQWPAQIGNGLALSSFETLSTDSDPDEWCGNVALIFGRHLRMKNDHLSRQALSGHT